MPLTAAEQRARRLAEQRRRVSSAQHAARRAYSSVCPDDRTPTSTAPTTPTATARTTRSPPKPAMMRAPPLLHQVAAGRTQTTATTALVRPLLTPPRTSCPTATLLRAPLLTGLLYCAIASVHSNCCTTVACVHLPQPQPHLMHVRARFPCRISSCWREQPHAALPSHSCPLLPECGKRACAQACKRRT